MTNQDSVGARPAGQTVRRRRPVRPARVPLGRPFQRAFLVLHIVTAVGLLGADAGLLALVIRGAHNSSPTWAFPAAAYLGTWVLQPLAVVSLLTGLWQGLVTKWGVLRFWWTVIKLTLNAAGLVLATTVLVPTLHDASATVRAGVAYPGGGGLVRDSSAAIGVLMVTVVVSVFKPFGRTAQQ